MLSEIDELAIRAATDEQARERIIQDHERVILKIASRVTHRFVTKSDDEWSVALCAFSKAIDTYRADAGSFPAYAETVIRHSLIDEFRRQTRRLQEFAVPPQAFDDAAEETISPDVHYAVVRGSLLAADSTLKDEIITLTAACEAFGFKFIDLTRSSPRQDKTRSACARAVRFLLRDSSSLERLFKSRQLPTQALIQQAGLSRKLLDRYRKYIIVATVVLSGDYPALAEYFTFIGKEAAL